ncbi:MAG: LytR C-terminal domain-containing protein [Bifidobacteriaceae bacterium]|jgi:hypothetical protein|nr:LytR C-terminal domain-containing protein [Bifidobacteriaceae bacterium]
MKAKDLWRVRKRRLIMRQTLILGLLIAVIAVAGVASAAMFLGRMDPLLSAPFSSPTPLSEDHGPTPCPRDESSMYPQAALVTVNVLNGSSMNGAATYLAQALERRGFIVGRVDNAPIEYSGVALLRTGELGLSRAYLLLAHAPEGTLLTLDNRADESVDMIIGAQYETLRPLETVNVHSGTVIPFPADCTPLAELLAGAAPAATPSSLPSPTSSSPGVVREP